MELRRATMEDAEAILSWRNDETTRAGSFTQNIITLDSHKKWMERKLADKSCYMFMLTEGEELLGNIRLDLADGKGEIAEISYMINPLFRGKGHGKDILRLVEKELPPTVKALTGFVKNENEASMKCFEKNGYVRLSAGDIMGFIKLMK